MMGLYVVGIVNDGSCWLVDVLFVSWIVERMVILMMDWGICYVVILCMKGVYFVVDLVCYVFCYFYYMGIEVF